MVVSLNIAISRKTDKHKTSRLTYLVSHGSCAKFETGARNTLTLFACGLNENLLGRVRIKQFNETMKAISAV